MANDLKKQLLEMTAFPNVHFHYSDDAEIIRKAATRIAELEAALKEEKSNGKI